MSNKIEEHVIIYNSSKRLDKYKQFVNLKNK